MPEVVQFFLVVEVGVVEDLDVDGLGEVVELEAQLEIGWIFLVVFAFGEEFEAGEVVGAKGGELGFVGFVVPEEGKRFVFVVDGHIVGKPFRQTTCRLNVGIQHLDRGVDFVIRREQFFIGHAEGRHCTSFVRLNLGQFI